MERRIRELQRRIIADPLDINAAKALVRILEQTNHEEKFWVLKSLDKDFPENSDVYIFDSFGKFLKGLAEILESEINLWREFEEQDEWGGDRYSDDIEEEVVRRLSQNDYNEVLEVLDLVNEYSPTRVYLAEEISVNRV